MDRTQYGKLDATDTYRPYDIICKKKPLPGYALLADLQTNLSKSSSPHPASQLSPSPNTTVITQKEPATKSYTIITEYPTNRIPHNHSYHENEEQKSHSTNFENYHNGTHHNGRPSSLESSATINSHTHQNLHGDNQQMYRHETREEVRSESRSSGPHLSSTTPRAAVTNNLSELDTLLYDLNTTKHNSIVKDSTMVNGTRPSVDSLLDELNSVGNRESIEKRGMHYETRTSSSLYPQRATHVSASNATKELDDLMDSLSDFKTTNHDRSSVHASQNDLQKWTSGTISTIPYTNEDIPPRPPSPSDRDFLEVPPPRPPPPTEIVVHPPSVVSVPSVLPAPIVPSPTPSVVSIIYKQLDQPDHRPPDALVVDIMNQPEFGGPVKRNDAEYRWITDERKHQVKEIVEIPEEEVKLKMNPGKLSNELKTNQEKLRSPALVRKFINKDTAYAKPLPKRRSPSPPPKPKPKPKPQPPPNNQLDCMLGSLTSHMTEQGITTSQKGCCCACDKPIVGQVITALGKTWHPEHFVCYHCKLELGTKNFFERDGKPYCEPDYHNLFSPKCAYCSGPILDKCVTAMNKTWHPEHFFCAQCGNTFGEEGFHEKNGKPYCKEDYFNMFAPKCGGCNNPIMENYISALNAQWHPNCFVCRDCNQPFNGGSFFDHEGLPYCETHYHAKRGSLCAACGKPITGRCITAMFKKYHPEHFLCSFCLQQLNKGTFKEQNNKPYCHPCFDKLYG